LEQTLHRINQYFSAIEFVAIASPRGVLKDYLLAAGLASLF